MDLYVTLIGRVYLVTIILYKKAMELFWYCDGKLVVTVNRLTYKIGVSLFFGTRDLFNISYSRELYLFSKFLHFEEIVRVKMAVCFEMIVSET